MSLQPAELLLLSFVSCAILGIAVAMRRIRIRTRDEPLIQAALERIKGELRQGATLTARMHFYENAALSQWARRVAAEGVERIEAGEVGVGWELVDLALGLEPEDRLVVEIHAWALWAIGRREAASLRG